MSLISPKRLNACRTSGSQGLPVVWLLGLAGLVGYTGPVSATGARPMSSVSKTAVPSWLLRYTQIDIRLKGTLRRRAMAGLCTEGRLS